MKVGTVVNNIRALRGMSISELSRRSELSAIAITKIEKGQVESRHSTLQAIARGLKVPVALIYLLSLEPRDVGRNSEHIIGRIEFTAAALLMKAKLVPKKKPPSHKGAK